MDVNLPYELRHCWANLGQSTLAAAVRTVDGMDDEGELSVSSAVLIR